MGYLVVPNICLDLYHQFMVIFLLLTFLLHFKGLYFSIDFVEKQVLKFNKKNLWDKIIMPVIFLNQYLLFSSDGFELEFSGSSDPELKIFRAESSRAGAFLFLSWNRADISDNMYVRKSQIFWLIFPPSLYYQILHL